MIAQAEANLKAVLNEYQELRLQKPATMVNGLKLAGLRREIDLKEARLCFARTFVKK